LSSISKAHLQTFPPRLRRTSDRANANPHTQPPPPPPPALEKSLRAAGASRPYFHRQSCLYGHPWSRISVNRKSSIQWILPTPSSGNSWPPLGVAFTPGIRGANFSPDFSYSHTFAETRALGKDRKPSTFLSGRFGSQGPNSVHPNKSLEIRPNLVAKTLRLRIPPYKRIRRPLRATSITWESARPSTATAFTNGAMDDGSGRRSRHGYRRSLKRIPKNFSAHPLFFAYGQEKGLLASKYFCAHPTVSPKSIGRSRSL